MNWEAIVGFAEIAGVIGIVVSLLFVGHQVRQNTLQLRQDNLREVIRGTLDTNWQYHRNKEVFDIFGCACEDFDSQPPQDQAHFHSILVDLSFYLVLAKGLNESGLMDAAAHDINERYFMAILNTPGGQEWWEFARVAKPMPDYAIDYIQSLIDDPDREFPSITDLQPWISKSHASRT